MKPSMAVLDAVDAAPKLKTASVVLKYHAASGFRAEWTAKSGAVCPRPQTANQTLVAAAREIARVGAVAGCADEIAAAVAEAIKAVQDDMTKDTAA